MTSRFGRNGREFQGQKKRDFPTKQCKLLEKNQNIWMMNSIIDSRKANHCSEERNCKSQEGEKDGIQYKIKISKEKEKGDGSSCISLRLQ